MSTRNAVIFGASGGIGRALADHLDALGSTVHRRSRSAGDFDLLDPDSLERVVAELPVEPDLVFVATGALTVDGNRPERALSELDADVLRRAFELNAIGPALLARHLAPRMAPGGRVAFLSARLASIGDNGLGGWTSYRSSKAALNQIVRCAAIEQARRDPDSLWVALHPGTIETELTRPYARGRYTATPAECAAQLVQLMQALEPADSGGFFAYDGQPIPW